MSGKKSKKEVGTVEIPSDVSSEGIIGEKEKEQAELANLIVRKIFEQSTRITIKVAACDCPDRDECPLYKECKELAKIVDEFNEKIKQ